MIGIGKSVPPVLALLVAAALVLAGGCGPRDVEDYENPFELDLESFKDVAPQLLGYLEVGRISVDAEQLYAVAVGPDDRIYLSADRSLWVCSSDGEPESSIDLQAEASCLAVGPQSRLYLGLTDHVRVMSAEGSRSKDWERLDGRAIITSIATDGEQVLVADAGNQVVLRYDSQGNLLNRIGKKDPDRDIPGLLLPSPYLDLAIDSLGHLQVTNPGRHAIESYTTGDGRLRSSLGKPGMEIEGFCGCCNPVHMALLPDGGIVTAEKGLARVKVLKPTGELRWVVAGPRDLPEDSTELDLAVDSRGRILVLDTISGVVRIYRERQVS